MISIGFTRSQGGSWISQEINRKSGGRGYCHAFTYFHELGLVHEAHVKIGVRFVARDLEWGREYLVPFTNLTPERERLMLKQAAILAGNDYDLAGVAHFEVPWVKEDASKNFCSEAVVIIAKAGGYFPGVIASEISPNALRNLCDKHGFPDSDD